MDDSATPIQGDEQKLANLEQELKSVEGQTQPTPSVTPPPVPTPIVPEPIVPTTPPVVPPAPAVPVTTPPMSEVNEAPKKNPILWIAVFILFLAIIVAGAYFLIQSRLVGTSQPTPIPVETLSPSFEETMPPLPEATGSATPSALPSGSPSASPSASPTSTPTTTPGI